VSLFSVGIIAEAESEHCWSWESTFPAPYSLTRMQGGKAMSLNQTVADLKVKTVTVKKKSGSSWIKPPESHFVGGACYRLDLAFGNTGGQISYTDEQYRKDNVDIRVVAMGFMVGSDKYEEKTKLVFYTDSTYRTQVPSPRYRTSFSFNKYETTYADSLLTAYFKLASNVSHRAITTFRWDLGIYASVRNRVWRKSYSGV
jgi:hypothetical protein